MKFSGTSKKRKSQLMRVTTIGASGPAFPKQGARQSSISNALQDSGAALENKFSDRSITTNNRLVRRIMEDKVCELIAQRNALFGRPDFASTFMKKETFVKNKSEDLVEGKGYDGLIEIGREKFIGNERENFIGDERENFIENEHEKFIGNEHEIFVGNEHEKFVGNEHEKFIGNEHENFIGNEHENFIGSEQEPDELMFIDNKLDALERYLDGHEQISRRIERTKTILARVDREFAEFRRVLEVEE